MTLEFGGRAARHRDKLARRFGEISIVDEPKTSAVTRALRAYLNGDVGAIDTLATDGGGTPFQELVWAALRRIPAGRTVSYGELAATIGRPTAVRAVARANALNPIAIVVPCHRVIGANGKLTGYAGGLKKKAWLLEHEKMHTGPAAASTAAPDLFARHG